VTAYAIGIEKVALVRIGDHIKITRAQCRAAPPLWGQLRHSHGNRGV